MNSKLKAKYEMKSVDTIGNPGTLVYNKVDFYNGGWVLITNIAGCSYNPQWDIDKNI